MDTQIIIVVLILVVVMARNTSTGGSGVLQPASEKVWAFARAIATAEGWDNPAYRYRHLNNPGNIKGTVNGTFQLLSYPTEADGWNALIRQIEIMVSGRSRYYSAEMTLEEVARIYTGEAAYMNWARNVSRKLGVPTTATLGEILA